MPDKLRTVTSAVLFVLFMVSGLYGLSRLSLAAQRVNVAHPRANLLAKSGIPLEQVGSGHYTQAPAYFWGRLETKAGVVSAPPASSARIAYDPLITVDDAMTQVQRIARERQLPEPEVAELISRYTEGRLLGLLGPPRVNVRDLNRALDQMPDGDG